MTNCNIIMQIRPWREIVSSAEAGPHTELIFAFPDGLATAPIRDIIEVFQFVMKSTGLTAPIREAVLPLWLYG